MPIPSLVMAEVLGLPSDISRSFMDWSFDGSLIERPASPACTRWPAVQAYFTEQLALQRSLSEPTNHVFSLFMETEIEGEPLSDQEIVTELHFMIQAGVHTTRGLLIHVVQRLLESAELFNSLQNDRTLIIPFVEETLRHDSPVQRVTRRCMRPTTVGGTEMKGASGLRWGSPRPTATRKPMPTQRSFASTAKILGTTWPSAEAPTSVPEQRWRVWRR